MAAYSSGAAPGADEALDSLCRVRNADIVTCLYTTGKMESPDIPAEAVSRFSGAGAEGSTLNVHSGNVDTTATRCSNTVADKVDGRGATRGKVGSVAVSLDEDPCLPSWGSATGREADLQVYADSSTAQSTVDGGREHTRNEK